MGYVMERPSTDPLSLPWKAWEVTQKEIIMREYKGIVGVEEKLSEGYCPLSSLPAMKAGATPGQYISVSAVSLWVLCAKSLVTLYKSP